jgi:hypothetical protein
LNEFDYIMCMYNYVYTCVYIYINVYIYIYKCVYIYIYMCVCGYVLIWIDIHLNCYPYGVMWMYTD